MPKRQPAPRGLEETPRSPSEPELAGTWHAYTPRELKERCSELGGAQYLVEGILPERSLGLLVGDSGLGKSPLAYQLGMCVAAGLPFLGHTVQRGTVLCIDYENGLLQVVDMLASLAVHLGLPEAPSDMKLFNFNDAPPDWDGLGRSAAELIKAVKPRLVIIDSITAHCPEIEEKNTIATQKMKDFRTIIREVGCSILAIHHLRKPPPDPRLALDALDKGDVRKWFLQARGPRSLINGTDVRIGVDTPDANSPRAALTLRGFGRVRGEISTMYIDRTMNGDGEPLGYTRLAGIHLLNSLEQQRAYEKLPDRFRFKEARLAYGRGDQATHDFLKKCQAFGVLRQPHPRGEYKKVTEGAENDSK